MQSDSKSKPSFTNQKKNLTSRLLTSSLTCG